MASAKIINFPRAEWRRAVPRSLAPVRYAARPSCRGNAGGFGLLLFLTMLAAFLYLSGAANVARHDTLYAALLAAVWGVYFIHDKLLTTRLGRLLRIAGQFLAVAGVAGFFVFVYWIVLTHP